MERTALACELRPATNSVEFSIVSPRDDAEIRRLLRENPIQGAVTISLEREPDYFRGCSLGSAREITIVGRKDGRLLCIGNCSIRSRFINGKPTQVGYLGGLRLDRSVEGRFDLLRRGYRFFEEVSMGQDVPFYFTSIAADNARALQFLERNLPGMPRYELIGEFVSLIIPTGGHLNDDANLVRGTSTEQFFNENQAQFNLAAEWQENEFNQLSPFGWQRSIDVLDATGNTSASGVLWDQRAFKQTVVRGYSNLLKLASPVVNAFARFRGAGLPPVGSAMNLAFLSPVAVKGGSDALVRLVDAALGAAESSGIELLAVGLDLRNPALPVLLKTFRCRQYHSRLYSLHWQSNPSCRLDNHLLAPEVALL